MQPTDQTAVSDNVRRADRKVALHSKLPMITAAPLTTKPCGHARHVGCCPCCQRALAVVHAAQLGAAAAAARAWRAGHLVCVTSSSTPHAGVTPHAALWCQDPGGDAV